MIGRDKLQALVRHWAWEWHAGMPLEGGGRLVLSSDGPVLLHASAVHRAAVIGGRIRVGAPVESPLPRISGYAAEGILRRIASVAWGAYVTALPRVRPGGQGWDAFIDHPENGFGPLIDGNGHRVTGAYSTEALVEAILAAPPRPESLVEHCTARADEVLDG